MREDLPDPVKIVDIDEEYSITDNKTYPSDLLALSPTSEIDSRSTMNRAYYDITDNDDGVASCTTNDSQEKKLKRRQKKKCPVCKHLFSSYGFHNHVESCKRLKDWRCEWCSKKITDITPLRPVKGPDRANQLCPSCGNDYRGMDGDEESVATKDTSPKNTAVNKKTRNIKQTNIRRKRINRNNLSAKNSVYEDDDSFTTNDDSSVITKDQVKTVGGTKEGDKNSECFKELVYSTRRERPKRHKKPIVRLDPTARDRPPREATSPPHSSPANSKTRGGEQSEKGVTKKKEISQSKANENSGTRLNNWSSLHESLILLSALDQPLKVVQNGPGKWMFEEFSWKHENLLVEKSEGATAIKEENCSNVIKAITSILTQEFSDEIIEGKWDNLLYTYHSSSDLPDPIVHQRIKRRKGRGRTRKRSESSVRSSFPSSCIGKEIPIQVMSICLAMEDVCHVNIDKDKDVIDNQHQTDNEAILQRTAEKSPIENVHATRIALISAGWKYKPSSKNEGKNWEMSNNSCSLYQEDLSSFPCIMYSTKDAWEYHVKRVKTIIQKNLMQYVEFYQDSQEIKQKQLEALEPIYCTESTNNGDNIQEQAGKCSIQEEESTSLSKEDDHSDENITKEKNQIIMDDVQEATTDPLQQDQVDKIQESNDRDNIESSQKSSVEKRTTEDSPQETTLQNVEKVIDEDTEKLIDDSQQQATSNKQQERNDDSDNESREKRRKRRIQHIEEEEEALKKIKMMNTARVLSSKPEGKEVIPAPITLREISDLLLSRNEKITSMIKNSTINQLKKRDEVVSLNDPRPVLNCSWCGPQFQILDNPSIKELYRNDEIFEKAFDKVLVGSRNYYLPSCHACVYLCNLGWKMKASRQQKAPAPCDFYHKKVITEGDKVSSLSYPLPGYLDCNSIRYDVRYFTPDSSAGKGIELKSVREFLSCSTDLIINAIETEKLVIDHDYDNGNETEQRKNDTEVEEREESSIGKENNMSQESQQENFDDETIIAKSKVDKRLFQSDEEESLGNLMRRVRKKNEIVDSGTSKQDESNNENSMKEMNSRNEMIHKKPIIYVDEEPEWSREVPPLPCINGALNHKKGLRGIFQEDKFNILLDSHGSYIDIALRLITPLSVG